MATTAGETPTLMLTTSTGDVLAFAMQRAIFESASDGYAALPSNGTVTEAFGTLTLRGGNAGLNIFAVNALTSGNTINNIVLEIPVGATALINVSGADVAFRNGGFNASSGSTPASRILWNLSGAAFAGFSSVSLRGALLAPRALVELQNGSLAGQVVSNRLNGSSFGLGYEPFDGSLPPIGQTPVPEPASSGFAAVGLAAILLLRLRRRV